MAVCQAIEITGDPRPRTDLKGRAEFVSTTHKAKTGMNSQVCESADAQEGFCTK